VLHQHAPLTGAAASCGRRVYSGLLRVAGLRCGILLVCNERMAFPKCDLTRRVAEHLSQVRAVLLSGKWVQQHSGRSEGFIRWHLERAGRMSPSAAATLAPCLSSVFHCCNKRD
jgi:hypothetical protein